MAVDSFSIASFRLTVYINDTIHAADTVFASYNGTNLLGDDDVPVTGFSKLLIKNSSTYSDILSTLYNSLNIFPNPNSSGIFHYRLDGSVIPGKTRLMVINGEGKVMYKQVLSETEGKIDLRNKMPKGLYFFKVTYGKTTITRSVLKE